jgi:uncharacterized protein DUF11
VRLGQEIQEVPRGLTIRRSTGVALLGLAALALFAPAAGAAAPANDNFANAQQLAGAPPIQVNGNNTDATLEPGEPTHGSSSVWFSFTAPRSSILTIDLCLQQTGFQFLHVYRGATVANLNPVTTDSDFCGAGSPESFAYVDNFRATAGTTYRFALAGDEGVFTFRLREIPIPDNDSFANARRLQGHYPIRVNGTTVGSNLQQGERDHGAYSGFGSGDSSVWYSFTAPRSSSYQVDTCTSQEYTVLAIYTGNSLARLRPARARSDSPGCHSNGDAVRFRATRGVTYRIAVADGPGQLDGTFALKLIEYVFDAGITQTASRASVRRGGVVTYRVILKNHGTVPLATDVQMISSKPLKLAQPVTSTRYLSVRTTRGSCNRVTYFAAHPGVLCRVGSLPAGARMVVTLRVRLFESITHWPFLDLSQGGPGKISDDNGKNNDIRDSRRTTRVVGR